MQPPVWFHDTAAEPVVELLRWFVLQLNKIGQEQRQRKLARKLNSNNFPALHNYNNPDEIDFIKEALSELAEKPYCIWDLSCSREDQTTVTFNFSTEPIVREWLNMPLIDPVQQTWTDAINNWTAPPELDKGLLKLSTYPGVYSPDKLLEALGNLAVSLNQEAIKNVTWRRLSARFFFGDSKYLEPISRQQWMLSLFPKLLASIESRTLLLNVFLVNEPIGILLIENQDTFCWLMGLSGGVNSLKNLILVYSQGFMGSAQRSRDARAVQFMYQGRIENVEAFQAQWLQSHEMALPLFFWGDLDYAGMSILKSLRQVFPTITAWIPGYRHMLNALEGGAGHSPAQANKAAQTIVEFCGCDYADRFLLPCLRKTGRFIDQEWVGPIHMEDQNSFC